MGITTPAERLMRGGGGSPGAASY